MSKQYDSFMAELEHLMIKHNVVIYPSNYDILEVYDITMDEDVITSLDRFSDETKEINNAH